MKTAPDWAWFSQPEHKDRTYRLRLATPDELADLRSRTHFDDFTLAPGCWVHALCRIRREIPRLEMLLLVWPADAELTEEQCRDAWFSVTNLGGKVEERLQFLTSI